MRLVNYSKTVHELFNIYNNNTLSLLYVEISNTNNVHNLQNLQKKNP